MILPKQLEIISDRFIDKYNEIEKICRSEKSKKSLLKNYYRKDIFEFDVSRNEKKFYKDLKVEEKPNVKNALNQEDIKDRDLLESIVIKGVDSIGEFALAGCQNLKEVIIDEGVKSIDIGAFAACPHLERVVLPKTIEYIGEYAFERCKELKQINILSDLSKIGDRAFYQCDSLIYCNIEGNKVEIIVNEAFKDCKNLQLVSMPKEVKIIGDRSFENCGNLISISIPKGVKKIGESAFQNCCSGHQYMSNPEVKENGKIEWKDYMLPDFDVVVGIPETTEEIGPSAFSGCKHLRYFYMNENCKVKNIKENTFTGCEKLEKVDISNGVESIDEGAFSGCLALTDIQLPESVKKIGNKAFENCDNLRLVLTNGKVRLEANTFENSGKASTADLKELQLKTERRNGRYYDIVTSSKGSKGFTLAGIKKAIEFLNKDISEWR